MKLKTILPFLALTASTAFGQTALQSGINMADLNKAVQPGKSFYEFACGGWMKNHPIPDEYSRYGSFETLNETNRKQLREMIEGFAHSTQPQGSLGQKIGSLYNLAMDSTRRNSDGWKPIQPILESIYNAKNGKELTVLAAQLSRSGIPSYFNISAGADLKNSKMNLLSISQGGLALGNRDYYTENDEATTEIRNAYKEYIKKLFIMTGNTEAVATQKMEAVMNIENRIAKASYTMVQQRDPEGNYHKMSFVKLLADYPGIDWSTVFLEGGIPSVKEVSVDQPEPIHEVEKLMAETSLDDQKAYLAFNVINDAASSLDDNFRKTSFDFFGKTMSGRQVEQPSWKRAVSVVDDVLGEAVGKMYVEKYFPASSKARMLELVRNLQKSLGERIQAQNWMSAQTKEKAMEKLNAFYVKVGYPDKWKDYSALEINDTLSYYENLKRASEFLTADYIARHVNKPANRDEWQMTPQTINAYYNPTTNEICFPAGILQPPFFNPAADDAANYGAIGVVIGHEMTHGFDDQGSQFDKDGNLKSWWTEADRKNFEARTKVMADFFSNISVLPGLKANGKLTLGENIADHGGLNVAFQALQTAMAKNPLPVKDGFTPEQRFFLSYANVWAANIREAEIRNRVKNDPHSLGRWRVDGALPHIAAWYTAFKITKKDALFVPVKQRVNVW